MSIWDNPAAAEPYLCLDAEGSKRDNKVFANRFVSSPKILISLESFFKFASNKSLLFFISELQILNFLVLIKQKKGPLK